jgi:PAS domain-containing protein
VTANATRVDCGAVGTDPCPYRAVAEHLPDVAVFAFDRGLRFELASGATVAETGWRPEEILGRTLAELVPPERFGRPRRSASWPTRPAPGRRWSTAR